MVVVTASTVTVDGVLSTDNIVDLDVTETFVVSGDVTDSSAAAVASAEIWFIDTTDGDIVIATSDGTGPCR